MPVVVLNFSLISLMTTSLITSSKLPKNKVLSSNFQFTTRCTRCSDLFILRINDRKSLIFAYFVLIFILAPGHYTTPGQSEDRKGWQHDNLTTNLLIFTVFCLFTTVNHCFSLYLLKHVVMLSRCHTFSSWFRPGVMVTWCNINIAHLN